MVFNAEDKVRARRTDLYEYLITNHPEEVEICGSSLRLRNNHSLSVKKGYCGYYDFADGAKGNSVDFLTKILGYSYADAVQSLLTRSQEVKSIPQNDNVFRLPGLKPMSADAIDYLCNRRMLDKCFIDWLIQCGMIYQSKIAGYERIVFVNTERNYYEVHEIKGSRFRQVIAKAKDNMWAFHPRAESIQRRAYICESCIDAVSLCQLINDNAYYVSIGGVGNYQRIDRILGLGLEVIIAVDNDTAGNQCRQRYSDLRHLIPEHKDWNEDLYQMRKEQIINENDV